jgi:hypothetical protein
VATPARRHPHRGDLMSRNLTLAIGALLWVSFAVVDVHVIVDD